MSLNVTLSLEDIVEQLGKYRNQLVNAENAAQQIKGAIATCEHQMQWLVTKQNEHILQQAKGEQKNAIEEGKQPEDDIIEHLERDCSGETTEASGSDCAEQSGQEQQEEVV